MEMKLSKKINCDVYSSLLEVKFVDPKRTDILAFLMFVEENGTVTVKDVNIEFLRQENGKHPFGERYVNLMIGYGFLGESDNNFYLTDQAAEMVKDKGVMFPERGDYRVCVSDDVIFDDPVIGITPENKYRKDQKMKNDNNASKSVTDKDLEKFEKEWENKVLCLPINGNKKAIIDKVEGCQSLPGEEYELIIKMSENNSGATLKRGDVSEDFVTNSMPEFEYVLARVAEKARMAYSKKDKRVLVDKAHLSTIKDGFFIDLPAAEIKLTKFGSFSVQSVKNVPCMPESIEVARDWILLTAMKAVENKYTTHASFDELILKESSKIKDWYPVQQIVREITYSKILKDAKKRNEQRDETYWHIVATNDLSPEESV